MNRKLLLITATIALAVVGSVGASFLLAPSNIDPAKKFAWSENAGWTNWFDANGSANGVFIHADHLSGSIWMENVGWVNVGNGGGPYANTNDTNFGVNILLGGNLGGYGWGENIGWVNFSTAAQAPNQARFDAGTGRFRGYAWAENIGWINLDDPTNFVAIAPEIPDAPIADGTDIDKTRFISFGLLGAATAAANQTALRVTLVSLHHVVPPYNDGPSIPFTSFEGQVRWVGPPAQYVESSSVPIQFFAASLQCTPHYRDWSTVGLLHVTGSAIVPSSIYEVQAVAASCMGNEGSCSAVSAPLEVGTTRWGDVQTPYNPPSITAQPDVGDFAALVNKFRSFPGAPIKARAHLAGTDAFGNITPTTLGLDFNFTHIAACVDAFRGKPYPYTISACP